MPQLPLATSGQLDVGRRRCSEADVYDSFVTSSNYAGSATRQNIWAEYAQGRDLLRSTSVRLHAVWFGGSFTTPKLDPQDMDVVFWVSGRDFARASSGDRQLVGAFVLAPRPPFGAPSRKHGLPLLDSYVAEWTPYPALDPSGGSPGEALYCQQRGYWDDFWQRLRTGPKTALPTWPDALPQRGYLEVEYDVFGR